MSDPSRLLERLAIDPVVPSKATPFTRGLQHDPSDRSLVPAIIAIARQLKFEVVAEGVQSTPQADLLRALGCDRFQGYLFGFPYPSSEIQTRLVRVGFERARNPTLQDPAS